MIIRGINIALLSMSIVISLLILLYQFIDRDKDAGNRWFNGLIVCNILMLIGDLCDRGLGGTKYPWAHTVINVTAIWIYYIATAALIFTALGWVFAMVSVRVNPSKIWIKIGALLLLGEFLVVSTTPIHKAVYVDEFNYYQRGELFFIMTIIPYILCVLCVCFLFIYMKQFKRREFLPILAFVSIPITANIIQIMNNKLLIMNVVVSLGLIVSNSFIQHQRKIDKEMQLNELVIEKNDKLEKLSEKTVSALAYTIDSKDRYTSGHSQRVANYSLELAKRMGKSPEEQQTIYYAGLLHDVGKIRVPEAVINKPGKLTDEEFDQIKIHPVSGYHTLKDIYDDKKIALGAKYHHERYDGTGYPNNLTGDNIPEIARIIGVADAYDAMASNRSYRDALPQEIVRSEIEKGKGKQFDPTIAEIMIQMIDEDVNYEMCQKDTVYKDVLVIDDEPMNIKMVKFILKNESVNIHSANSGVEGLRILKEQAMDLVLLDIAMPNMDGFEVFEKLREITSVPVVFMTADKNLESIKKSAELGVDDYVTKPFLPLVLKETVHGIVNQWG